MSATADERVYVERGRSVPDCDDRRVTYILADRDAAWRVASRFRQLRGDDYVGGFVLRRFESFVGAEVRTWWVEGSCRLVTAHPDTLERLPAAEFDLSAVEASVRALDLPFVTADFALRDDGRWRIVEIGDGQVSDGHAAPGLPADRGSQH
ncbi:ATP-grasp domain-containing protein [Micromonospora chersina]|uniref:ATP-grasp domain-containing protein n=1 Tax=Micromonospora chersina TaxID=47854 RepID=UPI003675B0A0